MSFTGVTPKATSGSFYHHSQHREEPQCYTEPGNSSWAVMGPGPRGQQQQLWTLLEPKTQVRTQGSHWPASVSCILPGK